jgi:hypothetical protein
MLGMVQIDSLDRKGGLLIILTFVKRKVAKKRVVKLLSPP